MCGERGASLLEQSLKISKLLGIIPSKKEVMAAEERLKMLIAEAQMILGSGSGSFLKFDEMSR